MFEGLFIIQRRPSNEQAPPTAPQRALGVPLIKSEVQSKLQPIRLCCNLTRPVLLSVLPRLDLNIFGKLALCNLEDLDD